MRDEVKFRDLITKVGPPFERECLREGTRIKFLCDVLGKRTKGAFGTVLRELPNGFVEVEIDFMDNFKYATAMPWLDFQVADDSLA